MNQKNLPKRALTKILNRFPIQYPNTIWYLFQKGKNYIEGDTVFFTLWLINVPNDTYPVEKYYNTKIGIKALSVKTSQYITGSLYDYKGKLLEFPKKSQAGLTEIKVILNNNYLVNWDLYKIYKSSNYPVPSKEGALRGAHYFKRTILINNEATDVIVPLQLINDFFFLSHSTKLNTFILSNTISENVKYLGIGQINNLSIGSLSQNRLEIKKTEALYYGRYFFTQNNIGFEAINELRSNHLIEIMKGKNEVYLKSKIPFSFDIEFNLTGQYIDENVYLANRIIGFNTMGKKPFIVDKLAVSVLNDNSKTGNYLSDDLKIFNITENDYSKVGENLDNHNSSQTGEIFDIKFSQDEKYSFSLTPPNEVLSKDSNKFKYILDKIIKGNEYNGGTENLNGIKKEPDIAKVNTEISIFNLLDWNLYAIKALIRLCKEKGYVGHFIKLNNNNDFFSFKNYSTGIDVLSWTPQGVEKNFKFILFEILTDDNKYYYFFEKGAGSYSSLFSDINHSQIELNRINVFLKKAINNEKLKWSKIYQSQKFISEGIIVYQPIEHITIKNKKDEEGEEKLIKELIKRIMKRLRIKN